MCFEKNYADFFVSTFHGEVLGKSASFNWVTWFQLGNWVRRLFLSWKAAGTKAWEN